MKKMVEKVLGIIKQKEEQLQQNLEEVDRLKEENNDLKREINLHKSDLVSFNRYLDEKTREELNISEIISKPATTSTSSKLNFGDVVLEALAKKAPQTVNELYEYYKTKPGKETLNYSAFISGMKRLYEKGIVQAHTSGKSTSKEHLVGLPDMFEGDELKQEHLKKIG